MRDPQSTRPSMLIRIRDAKDSQAWSQFVELYAPLVYGFARRHGLQDADAGDLTQEVLQAVARSARRLEYDPRRGTFRGWLFTVVRNKLRNFLASPARQIRGSGDTNHQNRLDELPAAEADPMAEWEGEHERRVFAWAAQQVRETVEESTWQAFWQTAVEGHKGKTVAEQLGIPVAAVYVAKSRIMAKLKATIQELELP